MISARQYADRVISLANKCIAKPEFVHRILYYDCPPFDEASIKEPRAHPLNAKVSIVSQREFEHQEAFLEKLKLAEYFATRLGELSFDGWSPLKHALADVIKTGRPFRVPDFKPDLRQKGIDLKMGVDITLMAKERIIERLVVVTSDSDLVPAMKLARREGIQVILASLGATSTKRLLREHVDIYRSVTL